jgi:hypothetical protein
MGFGSTFLIIPHPSRAFRGAASLALLAMTRFRCSQCGTDRTDFVVTSRGNPLSGARRRVSGRIGALTERRGIAGCHAPLHPPAMFVVTEAEAAAIRAVYQQRGEFSAAIELRRRFPGITDNAQARECARTIAGWKPLRPVKRMPRLPRSAQ